MVTRRSAGVLGGIAVVAALLGGCSAGPAGTTTPGVTEGASATSGAGTTTATAAGPGTPLAGYDTSRIELVDQTTRTIDGREWTFSSYANHAYQCGRTGDFPFLVVEPSDSAGDALPLWVLLHGGGIGYYTADGEYIGGEAHNDAESANGLTSVLTRFTGDDGESDTFIGDRFRAGDRFAIGSLCDHDLMLGLGEPYPDDPHGTDPTVDGLLANLAMVDAVTHGAADVEQRPTEGVWILGTSAGSYGAYGLAANLWLRGTPASGAVLDSGILSTPKIAMADAGVIRGGELDQDALDQIGEKVGPYFTDQSLWLENTLRAGFDTPFVLVTEAQDAACNGSRDAPALEGAVQAGYDSDCAWVQGVVQESVDAAGDPATQWTRIYPGSTHTASDEPGTAMQGDLRAWYTAAGGR